MAKAKKTTKPKFIRAEANELTVGINGRGDIINIEECADGKWKPEGTVFATAKEVDAIVAAASVTLKVTKTNSGYEVELDGEGGVNFGCQNFDAEELNRLHKLSLRARRKK